VPVLIYALGYPVKVAIPMSLIVVGVTSLIGVMGHARAGTVHWRTALAFGPSAILGALAGAHLGLRVTASLQLTIFAIVMMAGSVAMWFGTALWQRRAAPGGVRNPRHVVADALVGAAVGTLTGLVGIGGGFMYVPALVLLAGLGMKEAVGTSLVLIVMSAAAGFVRYAGAVSLDWGSTTLFTGLAIVGVVAGTRLGRGVPHASLRRGFALFLLLMGGIVLLFGR
jgi:uncharacterized membrane protein YfcA